MPFYLDGLRESIKIMISLIILALSVGCNQAIQVNRPAEPPDDPGLQTGTPLPTVDQTLTPTGKPTKTRAAAEEVESLRSSATLPPTRTLTPTSVHPGTIALKFYPPLVMDYDPAAWVDRSDYPNDQFVVNYLESQLLANCSIGVHGPSGIPPAPARAVTLGDVRYVVYTYDDSPWIGMSAWYIEDQSVPGHDYSQGLPVLVIASGLEEWRECKSQAELVLASLRTP